MRLKVSATAIWSAAASDGKRSATPLWLVFVPYPSQDELLKPKRRRSLLATALHKVPSVTDSFNHASASLPKPDRSFRQPAFDGATLLNPFVVEDGVIHNRAPVRGKDQVNLAVARLQCHGV